MPTITEIAYAKINLTLSVLGRRADGYHELDTIMHSISLTDTVELSPSGAISLTVDGRAPVGPDNLMWQAAARFFQVTGKQGGVAMHLVKRIPAEAGMGGGSADAAAVLRGLNRMTEAGLSEDILCRMGASLGADIPFCVTGGAARCGGIGDRLTPLPPWAGLPLLIVRPNVSVSTGQAYKEIDRLKIQRKQTSKAAERALRERDRDQLAEALANDFEAALFGISPILRETKREISIAGHPSLMTGSGSAFFVMAEGEEREILREKLSAAHPDWFIEKAELSAGNG